ncbi:hypothetical protein [Paenibacillus illinoisensis]|uniref:class II glutamine amidotransferase n=1 Tax=Paenibacillus illinoisensis TaxID=59845 RepID=UPI00301AB9A6
MCGINGMVFLNNFERSEEMWTAIRYVFDEALVETEARGKHATGLTVQRRDGAFYDFYKSDISATAMATYDDEYNRIVGSIGPWTSSIISHTRWYTKGKPENNLNNHPFDIGKIVGVHNGTVANDDELFKKYTDKFTRVGEVDSEIVYQLINHHNQEEITHDGLKLALEKTFLRGMFALAFAHKDQPSLVHIVKQERPMDFVLWEEAGVLLFNSDKEYIHNAFDKLKRAGKRFGFNGEVTLKLVEVKKDTYTVLDSNANTFEEMVKPAKELFLISSAVKTTYGNSSGTTYPTGGKNANTNYTSVSATDSIGRVIEGELDPITGEIIIFASTVMSEVGGNDDGSEMEESVWCIECGGELQEHEKHSSYNEGAVTHNDYYCEDCHSKALSSVFAG